MYDATQQVYSGIRFDVNNPDIKKIFINDIATSLSKICRYNGHCEGFYSVAEHSVLVANHIEICQNVSDLDIIMWGLMHDAAECYVGDTVKPIKNSIKTLRIVERKVMDAICRRFNLSKAEPEQVKKADWAIGALEYEEIMKPCLPGDEWYLPVSRPYNDACRTLRLNPPQAYDFFMERFNGISFAIEAKRRMEVG